MDFKNKHSIIRRAISLVGQMFLAGFAAFVVFFSLSFLSENFFGAIFLQIIILIVFFSLIYIALWHFGDRDRNSVNFGRMEKDLFRGVKIGVVASFLHLLSPILLIVTKFTGNIFTAIAFKLFNIHIISIINLLVPSLDPPITIGWAAIIVSFLLYLLFPLVAGLGYVAGYHYFEIMPKIIFKNKKKK